MELFYEELFKELDLPMDLQEEARERANKLGQWLKQDGEKRFNKDSVLYPQGSTLLGTAVRPIASNTGFDTDFVYKRDLQKENITQKDLKTQVGEQLNDYIAFLRGTGDEVPKLEESRRCWKLIYDRKYHLDIIPAIPDPEGESIICSEEGILITDRDLTRWQSSNPKGYHQWFNNIDSTIRLDEKKRLAKASHVQVEDIPDHKVKSNLQRVVQVLKRHRDLTYKGKKDDAPISIIITTLAAKAYTDHPSLIAALKGVLEKIERGIVIDNGVHFVKNPVNEKENFADKWQEYPERREAFFNWLKEAKDDFLALSEQQDVTTVSSRLRKSLGEDTITRVSANYQKRREKRDLLNIAVSSSPTKSQPWSE